MYSRFYVALTFLLGLSRACHASCNRDPPTFAEDYDKYPLVLQVTRTRPKKLLESDHCSVEMADNDYIETNLFPLFQIEKVFKDETGNGYEEGDEIPLIYDTDTGYQQVRKSLADGSTSWVVFLRSAYRCTADGKHTTHYFGECTRSNGPVSSLSRQDISTLNGEDDSDDSWEGLEKGLIQIKMDDDPEDFRWELEMQDSDWVQLVTEGPPSDDLPSPGETREIFFDMESDQDYCFSLWDSNGFKGSVAVYAVDRNGKKHLIYEGPNRTSKFTSYRVKFSWSD